MQKQEKCLKCGKCFENWDYKPQTWIYGKTNNRPLYTCEECIDDLNRIENWGTSKIYKKYVKKENNLLMRKMGRAVWVTICPTRDCTLEYLHKKIIKLTQGCIIVNGWWAYEWRHNISSWNGPMDELDNNGLHAHIYCKVTNLNSWKTKVKRMCTANKWLYNKKTVIECDYPETEKIDYIKGNTWELDKNAKKINKDVETRNKWKIKHFFDIGFRPGEIGLHLTYQPTLRDEFKGKNPYIAIETERAVNDTENENEL